MHARERLLLDPQWRFCRGDFTFPAGHTGWTKAGNFSFGPMDPRFDDGKWRVVSLPHDFIVEGDFINRLEVAGENHGIAGLAANQSMHAFHGSLPPGVGWYRKCFSVPETDVGRRLVLEFDGIARHARFWFNKHYLGTHLSGYTGCRFDVTELVEYGGTNTLVVRADASEYEGWFYEGGGIYRHAWLLKHHPLHVAADGVVVRAEVAAGGATATVAVQTTLRNDGDSAARGDLVTTLRTPAGRAAGTLRQTFTVEPGAEVCLAGHLAVVAPELWSVATPALYRLTSQVRLDGAVVDELTTPCGLRNVHVDPERGLLLNGEPVRLKGVCCHQDHAGVGAALPDALQEFRIRRLKEMGCNAYRCSHNPPTPELLDACDRLGMLVMDETRLFSSAPENLQQLESLVRRDRNHPCVVLWSIGNEEPLQGTAIGARIGAAMCRCLRHLDPTRPITMAMNGSWGLGVSAVVDVQGCNYLKTGNMTEFHAQFPRQPVLYSESASTLCTRGIYANDVDKGYVSAYDVNAPLWGNTAEDNWVHCLERPYVAGTFVWTGFDYRGEPTPYAWPCINSHFGILDMCGFPKDNFYYYQAWWGDQPVLHILPHWTWPGRDGEAIAVWVHSNCEEVELFLNRHSLGRQRVTPGRHLEWSVPYAPGTLAARGFRGGRKSLEAQVETAGPPTAIRLLAERDGLRADGEDTTQVTVQIVDAAGRVVPIADDLVSFKLSDNALLLGVGNGDPSSHENDKASARRAFNGLCAALVQAGLLPGPIVLEATAPGLQSARLELSGQRGARRPFVAAVDRNTESPFTCSALQAAPADVARARPPGARLIFRPVTTVTDAGFCDIRTFHGGEHGLVYIRRVVRTPAAGAGAVLYGADGPVRVWVNGTAVDCHPEATNPAQERQYRARVRWRRGDNDLVFGLVTNHGQAWGLYVHPVLPIG